MNSFTLDWARYTALARQAAAEGCVLLKNDNQTLPIQKNTVVSIFGRIALNYYRSGTGSGGKVNVTYTHSILDGLMACKDFQINQDLLNTYKEWISIHPFETGEGWGNEPWSQAEMPLTDELISQASTQSELALVVIGRTAGEDHDNTPSAGSYYLTETEEQMLKKVRKYFKKVAVILNVGNIIDMNWVSSYNPDAVMYVWQGGIEGGMGTADVLSGAVSPSGKLTDTIAHDLTDYPSHKNFGSPTENIYQEDIYVGYRYFETFAPYKVLYPFGFGLSYTTFSMSTVMEKAEDSLHFTVTVTNTGKRSGKEVIQIYCNPPQGALGKPLRNLVGIAKTEELKPNEFQTITLTINLKNLASFDDSGITGHVFCHVLEEGDYTFYLGNDVRSASYAGSFSLNHTLVVEMLSDSMAPVAPFTRIRPQLSKNKLDPDTIRECFEEVPLKHLKSNTNQSVPSASCLPYSGNLGLVLADVLSGKITLDQFLSQLTDEDLCHLVHGEGMCSPKVTPGTAAAFGGITQRLYDFGIPLCCCTDGPSGIRLDCGTPAFSLPNGTMLACTFNVVLVADLFEMEGLEMRSNRIDTLLGPGINIHRHPLNGRNFEYHSEDPFLTGKMACAQLDGMHRAGVTGTIKHFSANNQEAHRLYCNSVVSARALREIYLKAFEIAVKESNACSVMTTYGAVNGLWTAGNYEQNTLILRNEWGFKGILMTDWWAWMNDKGQEPSTKNLAAMVRSQNDLYMVTQDATKNGDNLNQALEDNKLTRALLIRSAKNICYFSMKSPAMMRLLKQDFPVKILNKPSSQKITADFGLKYEAISRKTIINLKDEDTTPGLHPLMAIHMDSDGLYKISITVSVQGSRLAQITASLQCKGEPLATFPFQGSNGAKITVEKECSFFGVTQYLSIYYSEHGLTLHEICFEKLEDITFRA